MKVYEPPEPPEPVSFWLQEAVAAVSVLAIATLFVYLAPLIFDAMATFQPWGAP